MTLTVTISWIVELMMGLTMIVEVTGQTSGVPLILVATCVQPALVHIQKL
ncbi:hypothetical protein C5S39_10815 [Candidatus Methanophagaceae archaeon]|jgi:uncharacterized membrane protein|nr:hypothetical protein C5S39_10815 [Methanophagales archaeon]